MKAPSLGLPAIMILCSVLCGCSLDASHPIASIKNALSSDVEIVRGGVLPDFNSTTVGKAFDGTFGNPKWSSFTTEKDQIVVQFNGEIPYSALEKAGFEPDDSPCGTERRAEYNKRWQQHLAAREADSWASQEKQVQAIYQGCVSRMITRVRFQFVLSADRRTFEIAWFDDKAFRNHDLDKVLRFIYQ